MLWTLMLAKHPTHISSPYVQKDPELGGVSSFPKKSEMARGPKKVGLDVRTLILAKTQHRDRSVTKKLMKRTIIEILTQVDARVQRFTK